MKIQRKCANKNYIFFIWLEITIYLKLSTFRKLYNKIMLEGSSRTHILWSTKFSVVISVWMSTKAHPLNYEHPFARSYGFLKSQWTHLCLYESKKLETGKMKLAIWVYVRTTDTRTYSGIKRWLTQVCQILWMEDRERLCKYVPGKARTKFDKIGKIFNDLFI